MDSKNDPCGMVVFHPFNGKLECIFRPIRDFNTGTMHRRIAIMVRFAGDAAIDGNRSSPSSRIHGNPEWVQTMPIAPN